MAKRRVYKRDRNGRFATVVGNTTAARARIKENKAKTRAARVPLTAENSRFVRSVEGYNVISNAKSAVGYGAFATGSFATGRPVAGSLFAAKAVLTGAQAANDAYRLRTVTSTGYKTGTIEERSKFDAAHGKRSKVINRANTAVTLAQFAAPAALRTISSRVNDRAARQNQARANVPLGITSGPRLIKPKRNGVYDITSVGSRRVA